MFICTLSSSRLRTSVLFTDHLPLLTFFLGEDGVSGALFVCKDLRLSLHNKSTFLGQDFELRHGLCVLQVLQDLRALLDARSACGDERSEEGRGGLV